LWLVQKNDEKIENPSEVLNMLLDRFPKQKEELRMEGFEQATRKLREEERVRLNRQAMRKFGTEVGGKTSAYLSELNAAEDFDRICDWIIGCPTRTDFLTKLSGAERASD